MKQSKTGSETLKASSDGFLPVRVVVFLLFCAFLGVALLIRGMGVLLAPFVVLFVAGTVAASGVKAYRPDSIGFVITAISLLWISTILFLVGTAWSMSTDVETLRVTFAMSGGVFLISFGLVGNSIQSFGYGASRAVVKQYSLSAIVLVLLAVLLLSQEFVTSVVSGFFELLIGAVGSGVLSDTGVYLRAFLGVFIYTVALYVLKVVVRKIPLEVFVTASEYHVVKQFRENLDALFKYGLLTIGGLLLATVAVFVVDLQYDDWWVDVLQAPLVAISSPTLLGVVFSLSAIGVSGILTARVLKRFTTIPPDELVKVLTPPFVLITISFVFAAVFENELLSIAESVFGAESTTLLELIAVEMSFSMVVLLLAIMVVGASVLLLPSVIVRLRIVDPSVSGLTTSVTCLGMLIMIAVLNHSNPLVILAATILCIVIWDVGEYSIIVVGEATPEQSRTLPNGFSQLVSIHTVIAVLLGATVLTASALLMQVLALLSVPASLAVLIIILSAVSLTIIMTLITG